jgi:hypothetical protein
MRAPDQAAAVRALDPDQVAHELERRGMEWADRNQAAEALEEARKSVIAQATLRANGRSHAEREAAALASAEVVDHLRRMVEARGEANRARVRYDVWRTYIELERSRHATERAAMTLR